MYMCIWKQLLFFNTISYYVIVMCESFRGMFQKQNYFEISIYVNKTKMNIIETCKYLEKHYNFTWTVL